MQIPVILRFDATSETGFGHAMRCLAVAQALLSNNLQCSVLTVQLPDVLQQYFNKLGIEVIQIDGTTGSEQDLAALLEAIRHFNSDWVLLDSYQFNEHYRQVVQQQKVRVATFDDSNELKCLHCDLLINALPTANQLGYEKSACDALQLLGMEYSLIRDEFTALKQNKFTERTKLLINFGASDVAGLTLPVLNAIVSTIDRTPMSLLAEQIIVLSGAGCKNIQAIKQFCADNGINHREHTDDMASLLNQTRLAICAPGTMVYELAYCGVASVFLTVADNQQLSASTQQLAGWCYSFDSREQGQLEQAVNKAGQLWLSEDKLVEMSLVAKGLVDGQGAQRIVKAMMGELA